MYKRPESVLVVIHDADGFFLLIRRADIENFWQSVTGSLRWGEGARDAAVRELKEETGIEAGSGLVDWDHSVHFRILDEFKPSYEPGTRHNLEHVFSLEVGHGQPVRLNATEHVEYKWKNLNESLEVVWSWSNRDAIAAVAKKYRLGR